MKWIREIKLLIERLIKKELADVHTHLPAQVVSYDPALNLCSVQPCINRIRSEDPDNLTTVQLPIIEDVPVKQFGSGKCLLSVAPQAGSYGILHVSERSLENWIVKGGVDDPTSPRKFDISDGFFDPGVYPIIPDGDNGLVVPPINTDRIELRTRLGTAYVSILDSGSVEIEGLPTVKIGGVSAADAAALASKVDTLWATLYTLLTTWTPVPADGGAAFKAASIAAFPTPPTPTGSTKLKITV